MWSIGAGKTEKILGLKQPELKEICDKYDHHYRSSYRYVRSARYKIHTA